MEKEIALQYLNVAVRGHCPLSFLRLTSQESLRSMGFILTECLDLYLITRKNSMLTQIQLQLLEISSFFHTK